MQEVRCHKCGKLLMKISGHFSLEVKCTRCKFFNKLERPRASLKIHSIKKVDTREQTHYSVDRRQTKTG